MTRISDVMAFAVKNTDYWTELLSGEEYPEELTDDETRALDAARAHIEALVVELLHSTGSKLSETLQNKRVRSIRFKRASTAKNRYITLPPPAGLGGKLYYIMFALDDDDDDDETGIVLYASLVVKKAALDSLVKALDNAGTKHEVDGYHVYAPGIPLEEGASIDDLATNAVNCAVALLAGCGGEKGSA